MKNELFASVLHHLYQLASADSAATVIRLARATGASREEVEAALDALDRAGLVDRERVRLTMAGLTIALGVSRPRARTILRAA
jgi:Mn-dependent DtxR family transcriptional regulator